MIRCGKGQLGFQKHEDVSLKSLDKLGVSVSDHDDWKPPTCYPPERHDGFGPIGAVPCCLAWDEAVLLGKFVGHGEDGVEAIE